MRCCEGGGGKSGAAGWVEIILANTSMQGFDLVKSQCFTLCFSLNKSGLYKTQKLLVFQTTHFYASYGYSVMSVNYLVVVVRK